MKNNQQVLRDTVVTVNLTKLKENISLIKKMAGSNVAIMAVVKANGYGHGACNIAPTLIESGVTYLAVATLSEAIELRQVSSDFPILIMGYTPSQYLETAIKNHISLTVFSYEDAQLIDTFAKKYNTISKVHIKVDTGFHRLGKAPTEAYAAEICQISALNNVETEGIFSHLALVNDCENKKQFSSFCDFVNLLEKKGCSFKYQHIADSIACVDFPEYHLNMIRPGALIYGMRGFHKGFLPVEQIISFESKVSQLHTVSKGEGVSYDYLWTAKRDSLIATLPFGYADGYSRNMYGKGYVLINGCTAPIIGVICMDQCMIDVTDIPDVAVGSKAIIYGDGLDGSMTIDEASKLAGTNKNDILTRITMRPPRVYVY